MDINDKKLKRTSKFVNWTISIVLSLFLIALSSIIIDDLDNTVNHPSYQSFVNQQEVNKYNESVSVVENKRIALYEVKSNYKKMEEAATSNKNAEQESFDNWIKTRSTIGSPQQDKEVLQRTHKIDEYRSIAQEWKGKCDSIQSDMDALRSQISEIESNISVINEEADKQYQASMNSYNIRVFLVRLLFVAPILALGIFLFIRYRNHKFGALFMGFSLFSVYAFL